MPIFNPLQKLLLCNDVGIAYAGHQYCSNGMPTELALKVLVEKIKLPDLKDHMNYSRSTRLAAIETQQQCLCNLLNNNTIAIKCKRLKSIVIGLQTRGSDMLDATVQVMVSAFYAVKEIGHRGQVGASMLQAATHRSARQNSCRQQQASEEMKSKQAIARWTNTSKEK
eukprot:Gb_08917 [translate_table: standard]